MYKTLIFIFVFLILAGAVLWRASHIPTLDSMPIESSLFPEPEKGSPQDDSQDRQDDAVSQNEFLAPINRPDQRVTIKPFGIFVAPQNSPVSPERFRGYHTAADFEVFPEELDAEVAVSAICDGELLLKENASGYGGVIVEACDLEGEPVTVVYGHLKLSSVDAKIGDQISAGDRLGILGVGQSAETDGERKHLHLGIHKGGDINILGYVQNGNSLADWIDPCLYVCGK